MHFKDIDWSQIIAALAILQLLGGVVKKIVNTLDLNAKIVEIEIELKKLKNSVAILEQSTKAKQDSLDQINFMLRILTSQVIEDKHAE